MSYHGSQLRDSMPPESEKGVLHTSSAPEELQETPSAGERRPADSPSKTSRTSSHKSFKIRISSHARKYELPTFAEASLLVRSLC